MQSFSKLPLFALPAAVEKLLVLPLRELDFRGKSFTGKKNLFGAKMEPQFRKEETFFLLFFSPISTDREKRRRKR